jgi:DNA-binding NtrC family response regulator
MREQSTTAQPLPRVLADNSFRVSHPEGEPTLLVAVSDSETRNALAVIMKAFSLNARWVSASHAATRLLESGDFAICVCGFSLDGGTYQDVARCARRQPVMVPVVMVSSPRPLNEYQDYLASMRAGAFDFICYPYERSEVARILRRAIAAHYASARAQLV